MIDNDELTACCFLSKLQEKFLGLIFSFSTVRQARKKPWIYINYSEVLSADSKKKSKEERLYWYKKMLSERENFLDM